MEDLVKLFRDELFSAFYTWLETNKDYLGKWYGRLYNEAKEADCDTAVKIMGVALWMFNMAANCGVMCGIGPTGPTWDNMTITEGLDEKSTKSLLIRIAACMNLQYLPKEIGTQEIPVITSKKFSLKLWSREHASLSGSGAEEAL